MYEPKVLYDKFQKHKIDEKLSISIGSSVVIDPSKIECLKSTKRSSIYKLFLRTKHDQYPIIFKIYNSSSYKNNVEINVYKKASSILREFLPQIYLIEENTIETWVFMEFVHQIRGQLTFTPKHFDYIIPTLAKLHAETFEDNFTKNKEIWKDWLPQYNSKGMSAERSKYIEKTLIFLDDAVTDKRVRDIVKPHYRPLVKAYQNGPDFFPELVVNGSSITHGDLHMQNICCRDVTSNAPWNIQFIDWESAKLAPVWIDMIVLVEILIAFRKDWQSQGDEIRSHTTELYAKEMNKYGIMFKTPPLDLYKMAYLQRTLEKGLHTQLRRLFDNRGGELLPYHLEKISTWGKELGIYK
ncbi:oxidoreductase family protein [Jeotgalibacillus soli]|uniref:oxidoreductase family protein n=1 Tax=Jeotgalibacillus soli TaxID=889306 RepID=UPI000597E5C6|nr:oxidoreductase family protein [Jeotgalibacillus soli]